MAAGSIKKDPNGTYYFVVDVGKNGVRKQVRRRGFKKIKDAQAAMTTILNEVNNDIYMKESPKTLTELMLEWIDVKSHNMTRLTIESYRSYITNHISPSIGNIKLENLQKKHIDKMTNDLRNKKTEKGKPYSSSTIQRIFNIVVTSLNYAKKEQLVKENVATESDRPKIKKKELEIWNVDEINTFLDGMKKSRHFIVYYLAIHTGMRQGEILGLPWRNVDFHNKIIRVTQTLEHDGKNIKQGTKNNKTRSVTISDEVIEELNNHKIRIDREKEKAGDLYVQNDLVACGSYGKPVFAETVTRFMRDKIKEINLRPIRFHDLRHTSASLMLMMGINPKIVSERLGHSSVIITLDTYSHMVPNLQEEAAQGLSRLLYRKS